MLEGASIRPLGPSSERLLAIAVYVMVWCSLLHSALTLILIKASIMPYLYFTVLTMSLSLLAALSIERPLSLNLFLGLSAVTVVLLAEEALLNGLHPDAGLALAFTAALSLSFAGSIPKLGEKVRHVLQVTGLIFASRLAFIPFPQRFLTINTAPPSIYTLIIVVMVAFIVVKRISLVRVGLTRGPYSIYRQIAVGASFGLLAGLVEYRILKPPPISLAGESLQTILYVIIVMTLFVGFGEELLFRGLVQESYQSVLPAWSAIQIASIQFGLMHYGWMNPLELLFAYGMGMIFGYLFWKTKSLTAPITMHALGNIAMFIVAAYPELMLTPIAIGLMVAFAAIVLLSAFPWRRLRKLEMRALLAPLTLNRDHLSKAKKRLETSTINSRLLQTLRKFTSQTHRIEEETQIPSGQYPPTSPIIGVCPYCGRELTEKAKYCDMCGARAQPSYWSQRSPNR